MNVVHCHPERKDERVDERSSARFRASFGALAPRLAHIARAAYLGAALVPAMVAVGMPVRRMPRPSTRPSNSTGPASSRTSTTPCRTSASSARALLPAISTGAKQAWIDARIGWERSEVFTGGFVPELDQKIDAWPNGLVGFHAIEAKLFGAGKTDAGPEVDALLESVSELSATVREIMLTPQGLLNGVARLAYEVGESKVDGGESRVSGTSLDDMRNNVDGIDLAYRTLFAPTIEAHEPRLAAEARRQIDELKSMLAARDLRRIDPDRLRAASEEFVLTLQNAAPKLQLERPTLEANAQ